MSLLLYGLDSEWLQADKLIRHSIISYLPRFVDTFGPVLRGFLIGGNLAERIAICRGSVPAFPINSDLP